ncbi:MAG: SLBB domain-containing protein [Bacteroidota bacterium]
MFLLKKQSLQLLALWIFLLGAFHTYGQTKGFSTGDNESLLKTDALEGLKSTQSLPNSTMAVDNIVSPAQYRMGPGDVLSLQILNAASAEQILIVTPENSVLLPRIGEVSLLKMTLAQAKDTLLKIIKARNPVANAYITLRQPRTAIISVRGNVLFPNSYSLPASMKVSTALKLANQPQGSGGQAASNEELRALRKYQAFSNQYDESVGIGSSGRAQPYAMRNTVVKHNDGTTEVADIERSLATGEPAFNFHLREGDEIYVPFEPRSFPTISISGGVRRSGVFAFKNGDKASLLLKLGLGISESGDFSRVFLKIPGGERRQLNVDSALNLRETDIALEPGSAIIIEEKTYPMSLKQGVVTVSGAVRSPGTFVVEPHVTRLKDIIGQAGGFEEEAYLPLAYILRREPNQSIQVDERYGLFEKFQYSNLTLEDTVRYLFDMSYRRPIVSADFVSAFKNNSEKDNVPLEDGDVIVIPTNPKRVYIFGQVNKPGYIEYTPGKSMTWYIEQAGGFASGAERERSRIIRGRTNVWEEDAPGVTVNAGDEIYVPRPPDVSKSLELQSQGIWASLISTAVFGLIGIANIIIQLNR